MDAMMPRISTALRSHDSCDITHASIDAAVKKERGSVFVLTNVERTRPCSLLLMGLFAVGTPVIVFANGSHVSGSRYRLWTSRSSTAVPREKRCGGHEDDPLLSIPVTGPDRLREPFPCRRTPRAGERSGNCRRTPHGRSWVPCLAHRSYR